MKKLAFVVSHIVLAGVALSSVALAQQNTAGDQSKLVQIVRNSTWQYMEVSSATAAGYGPFLGCVSGSDHGAMGMHYVNPTLLNGTLDPTHPQALIYEPSNGQMTLVGVEFIVDAATWLKNNANPPVLRVRPSCSSIAQTDTTYRRSSNFTSGLGGRTRWVRLWTGTTM